ncbi:uncharacterized protein NPIL_18121 [Nephila pilipes]|uniref:Uncharacterized protein n=1 Tax=Nephila pilipes TaxID=299642 RepID=A0A8X6P486_NEPPI|nr:uncharacterized protein NPIL_18121 [Nephila pilipes]
MVAVYGERRLGRTAVNKWCTSFCEGRLTISDLLRPGKAKIVITDYSIAPVDAMIRADGRVQTRDISDELNLCKGMVHHTIVHQHLQNSEVCTEWVPKHLTLDHQKH